MRLYGYSEVLEVEYDNIFKEFLEEKYIRTLLGNPIVIREFFFKGVLKKAIIEYWENLLDTPSKRTLRIGTFGFFHSIRKNQYKVVRDEYNSWIKN